MTTGMSINTSDRVILVGKTGSGKTYLARNMLLSAQRLIAIDSKFLFDPDEWRAEVVHELPAFNELDHDFRLIVRPAEFELLGEQLLALEDYYLYIDELYAVFDSPLKISPPWKGLWTRGRELNIGIWAGVQRPASIPLVTMSEAGHFFIFNLSMKEDRQRMAEITQVEIRTLPKYSFYYVRPDQDVYWQVGKLEVKVK